MNRNRNRIAGLLGLTLIVCLVAACTVPHVQMVREAQDAFSEGAAMELEHKFNPESPGDMMTSAAEKYQIAYGMAEQVLRQAPSDLEKDKLLGTALTVKAYSAWRLGDMATASETAAEVGKMSEGLWPRDKSLCAILVSLMKIDAIGVRAEKIGKIEGATDQAQALKKLQDDAEKTFKDLKNEFVADSQTGAYVGQALCELVFAEQRALGSVDPKLLNQAAVDIHNNMRAKALKALEDVEIVAKDDEYRRRVEARLQYYGHPTTGVLKVLEPTP